MAGRPRTQVTKSAKSLEGRLWEAADALRGNQEPSEYKHVVLGVVFLKYISERFEERRSAIELVLQQAEVFAASDAAA
jgi:type I restriction enzyme M protein